MKRKVEIILPLCILIFFSISVVSIYSSSSILSINYSNLYIKEIIWYAIGLIFFLITIFLGNEKIYRYSSYFYIISIIFLCLVLVFGVEVNNTKGWIDLGIIRFQPSELAKLGLILYLSKILNDYHFSDIKNSKEEFKLILKVLLITFIPSILAFIEPDTGSVISFLFIAFIMIFISGIRGRWFILLFIILGFFITGFIILYINYPTKFVNIFGDSMYYRIYRFIDWTNTSGMQLENSMISIGTAGLKGFGINNTPVYFPEPYTDFIFAVFTSNYGLIGSLGLIITLIIFDTRIIDIGIKSTKTIDKYLVAGIIAFFIYPQIQNIAMTVGLLPITGIPLPFISYGGSNLIISFIMVALIINMTKQKEHLKSALLDIK